MVRSITNHKLLILVVLVSAFCLLTTPASAGEYQLDPSNASDTVRFNSRAKLEFIEGTTTQIRGYLHFDPENSADSVSGILEVDLASLKTGIGVRDEHMRERHLHTDKFPKAWFQLSSVSGLPQTLRQDTTYAATANGAFYIHGVHRQVEARLTVRRILVESNESLLVTATFEITLDDFEIKRPRALFLKLAKVIEVTVIFRASESEVESTIELPTWKSKD